LLEKKSNDRKRCKQRLTKQLERRFNASEKRGPRRNEQHKRRLAEMKREQQKALQERQALEQAKRDREARQTAEREKAVRENAGRERQHQFANVRCDASQKPVCSLSCW
jgi:hypothetical protein